MIRHERHLVFATWSNNVYKLDNYTQDIYSSPQVYIKADWMGVVWEEFVATSIDTFPHQS